VTGEDAERPRILIPADIDKDLLIPIGNSKLKTGAGGRRHKTQNASSPRFQSELALELTAGCEFHEVPAGRISAFD
jgi:hypothetical protein